MGKTLLDIAREKRAEVMAPADQLIAAAEAESRDGESHSGDDFNEFHGCCFPSFLGE